VSFTLPVQIKKDKTMKTKFICTFLLVLATNQVHSKSLFEATDWVTDNTFTTGVEGPAVDKHGDLYAVNFMQQGIIGKVTGKDEVTKLVSLKNGSIGNGIRFDSEGYMYF
jgi:uncharacterized protein (DUF2342 family)